jgi:hypothetical protein
VCITSHPAHEKVGPSCRRLTISPALTWLDSASTFSRILNDEEIVVVVNTNAAQGISVDVIVDNHLNRPGARFQILYSNKGTTTMPPVHEIRAATVQEVDGTIGCHPLQVISVALQPCEVQLLAQNEEIRLV